MNIYDVRGSGVMRYDGDQDQTGISGGYSLRSYIKVLLEVKQINFFFFKSSKRYTVLKVKTCAWHIVEYNTEIT